MHVRVKYISWTMLSLLALNQPLQRKTSEFTSSAEVPHANCTNKLPVGSPRYKGPAAVIITTKHRNQHLEEFMRSVCKRQQRLGVMCSLPVVSLSRIWICILDGPQLEKALLGYMDDFNTLLAYY